jgi:Ca2+-binding RTX toxin-like protein
MQQVFVFSPSTGGDDTMNGGSGLDFVFGQSGNDSLLGGNGDFVDSLSGGSGRDVLHGDSGADALFGGFGGGGGNTDALAGDIMLYVDSNAAVNVNLNDNLTETGGHAQGDFITGVEHLDGSAFNDSLTGIGSLQSGQEAFALNNSIGGGSGNDAIFGLDGNDSLFGDFLPAFAAGGGIDSMFGGSGNDLMYGGDAGDSMFGDAGADTMFGDTSDDTMTGGAGADTLNGGTHGLGDFASYLTSSAGVNVDLGDGVTETGGDAAGDSIVGIEHVYGSSFADRLAGDLSRNSLIGQAGDDTIFGADGNDFLIGDLIAGGVSGSDSLFGGTGIDQLDGMDGNDTLHGGAGSGLNGDALGGGSGNDWASYLDATVGVTADLSTNTGTGGDATGDTYSAIENLIGGDGGDTLTGDGGANSLLGMGGNDTLTGGLGADVLNGGAHGTGDWANYVNSNAAVIVNLQDGLAESGGHAQGDSLFDIEHIFGSTTGNDTLTGNLNGNSLVGHSGLDQLFGNDGADALFGEANNDTLTGGADADSLFGGGNADVASYEGSHLGVYVNLTDAAPESQGHAEGDVLDSIESLIGSDQNDTLITVSGAEENAISGGLGNDTMDGRDGADSMNGGAGSDWAYYNDSGAAVTVDLTDANLETGGMAQGDFLTLIENLLGSSFNDILIAGVGVNILDGAAGDDLLDGGADADTMIGGAGTDTADYVKSNAGVTVDLSDDETEVGGHAQGDSLTGIENLIGSILDDHLIGDDNVNTIVALGDDDTVEGGDAADSLFGGSGFDWVDYSNSDWAVTVTLGSTDAQTGEIDGDQIGDVLSGFEAVRGSNQNDQGDTLTSVLSSAILDGQLGDDFFIAGAGADSFIGGFGSDTVDYRLSGTAVNVNLATGVGSGGLAAGDLYTDVENVLGSNFNDILVGLAGSNTLAGFDGDDSLFGGSSTDSLIGDIGDDFIQGGSGGDSIVGGAGSNDFAVYTNDVSQTEGVTVDLSTGTGTGGDASDDTPDSEGNPQSIGETLFGIEHVIGSGNNDSINGDDGVNWLFGASGIDALRGGGGNDSLFGGDGNDLLGGFAPGAVDTGADSLFGGTGNDSLFYDPNDTALVGGIGNDLLIGRSGFDSVQLDAARWNFNGGFADIETFDLGDGNDVFLNTSSVTDLVNIGQGLNVFGGSGRDQISMRGAAGAFSGMDDNLDGGAGNDIIWGGFGHDGISGGEGDDQLYGGKGDEKFFGNQGFDVFYVGQAEGTDLIFDEATEVNGLVLFWGWDSTFPPVGSGADVFDGVDPSEIMIDYAGNQVTITFTERGGTVTFERVDNGDGTWDSTVDILNLWDYGNGDAGNSSTVPPTFARDVWSATFDASTGEFTAFTLAVNG